MHIMGPYIGPYFGPCFVARVAYCAVRAEIFCSVGCPMYAVWDAPPVVPRVHGVLAMPVEQ
jgi:hypothetical protein